MKFKLNDWVIVKGVTPKDTPILVTVQENDLTLSQGIRYDNSKTIRFGEIERVITQENNPEYFLWVSLSQAKFGCRGSIL